MVWCHRAFSWGHNSGKLTSVEMILGLGYRGIADLCNLSPLMFWDFLPGMGITTVQGYYLSTNSQLDIIDIILISRASTYFDRMHMFSIRNLPPKLLPPKFL